jgi:hypothetical protein
MKSYIIVGLIGIIGTIGIIGYNKGFLEGITKCENTQSFESNYYGMHIIYNVNKK